MAGEAVRVEGITELRGALREIDPALQKNLRVRFKTLAEKIAAKVRAKMPHRSGRAAGSVKGGVSASTAYVQEGRSSAAYVPWLDYGGTLRPSGMRHNTQVRERVSGGRYLMPTIRESRTEIEEDAAKAFDDTARELGLS